MFSNPIHRSITAATNFVRSLAVTASNHKTVLATASIGVAVLGASLACSPSFRRQVQAKAETAFSSVQAFYREIKVPLLIGGLSTAIGTGAIVCGMKLFPSTVVPLVDRLVDVWTRGDPDRVAK